MKTKKENTAIDYLGYALYAFGGLGLEILLMMIETSVFGTVSNEWTIAQSIIHWVLTCVIWGCIGFLLIKQLPQTKHKITFTNWAITGIVFITSIIYTSITWGGFKPALEFATNGTSRFIFQYIYYVFEGLLITLIVAHGQKAFECWFKSIKIVPFGGILLAVTWGLIHILTQGNSTGLYAFIQALLYGVIYLSLNKNFKLSYVVITLMFML